MKNVLSVVLASLLALLLFSQCKKDDNEIYNAGFYTSQETGKLFLYIDGSYVGDLPFFASAPSCEQNFNETESPLYYQLRSGEYRITGKDEHGTVISDGYLKINKSTFGGPQITGGQIAQRSGNCVMVGLF